MPLRAPSVETKRSGSGSGSCMLAMRSSNFGPPSLLWYSNTRNGTPALVVPEIASSTLRTNPRPNGGAPAQRADVALPSNDQEGDDGKDEQDDRDQDDHDGAVQPTCSLVLKKRLSGCSTRYMADTMSRPPMIIRAVMLSPPKVTAKPAAQTGSIAMITAAREGSMCA
jgi:hypothetical protein